jgi:protein SCO1/2
VKHFLRILIVLLGIAIAGVLVYRVSHSQPAAPSGPKSDALPVYSSIPEFKFTNQASQAFGSAELAGKVWAANFIFTRCPATCPVQTLRMGQLQKQLSQDPRWKDMQLVSFSVEPEHDTPSVLRDFAEQKHAQPGQWHFLTGARSEIWQLSTNGFKLAVGEAAPHAGSPLFHSPMLVVVDQQRRIRGYYDGMTEAGINEAAAAIRTALSELED